MILNDEARYLSQADLYVITPQMLAVVAAAAQTLRYSDLSLLRDDDLPGPAGLLVLPQPLRLRLPTGSIEETQAYTWRLPWRIPLPQNQDFAGTDLPAVRMSAYTSARRANPDFRREVRRLGTAATDPAGHHLVAAPAPGHTPRPGWHVRAADRQEAPAAAIWRG
jgi:hypothetical protein